MSEYRENNIEWQKGESRKEQNKTQKKISLLFGQTRKIVNQLMI